MLDPKLLPSVSTKTMPLFILALIFSFVTTRGLCSQIPVPREHFVIQVYVDPLHGDDSKASTYNPVPNTSMAYLGQHPAPPAARQPGGKLTHVPFPFRTVTSALTYITTNFSTPPPSSTTWGKDKWYNPASDCYVDHIVIHCLPGLYGPLKGGETNPADPKSGLPWNGEVFPLVLPDRVAIQGASALNTIFDARHEVTSIFAVDTTASRVSLFYTFCRVFIDGITIRGARGDGKLHGGCQFPAGAGVMVDDALNQVPNESVELTISNCFIVDNSVGVAISSQYGSTCHHPRIINNTFAWNAIGIWNGGDCRVTIATPINATHKPFIINNIFDHSSPNIDRQTKPGTSQPFPWYSQLIPGSSAFEGLSAHDTTVYQLNGNTLNIDYNAYDPSKINLSQTGIPGNWPTGWPRVTPRATTLVFTPRVNISLYTNGTGVFQRNTLYINDIFWWYTNSGTTPALPQNFDYSPHDFRLPLAITSDGGGTWTVNPLIDVGLDIVEGTIPNPNGGLFWLKMGVNTNDHEMLEVPGIPSGNTSPAPNEVPMGGYGKPGSFADYATFLCNDQDAEGFGNKRRFNHPFVSGPSNDITDIGADEVGTLVMAGYINGTTMFSKEPELRVIYKTTNTIENVEVYFFGYPASSYQRPRFNLLSSISCCRQSGYQTYDWWRYLWRSNPGVSFICSSPTVAAPVPDGNYTRGEGADSFNPGNSASWRGYIVEQYRSGLPTDRDVDPFPGSLISDYSPHLLSSFMDGHPNWALIPDVWDWRASAANKSTFRYDPYNTGHADGGFKPPHGDAFSCCPWVRNPADDSTLLDEWEASHGTDNENLFYTRGITASISGIVNPPGSFYLVYSSGEASWLSLHFASTPVFDPESSTRSIYTCNSWGFGDVNLTPSPWDTVPFTGALWCPAYRWNCEVGRDFDPSGQTSNLQSFTSINWDTTSQMSKSTGGFFLSSRSFIENSIKASSNNIKYLPGLNVKPK